MILNPAAVALTIGSVLVSSFMVYASAIGLQIVRFWDMRSGSERQLSLERKTYLVSTILSYAMVFELLSLLLFVYMTDAMHVLFVGAMCAAGTLNVNAYGYPTLILKAANFVLCGIWLIVNHTDNAAPDYPLIRAKYKFLAWIAGCVVLGTLLQCSYIMDLRPAVITSCCGVLFDAEAPSIAGEIAHLPPYWMKMMFYTGMLLTMRIGIYFYVKGKGAKLFSWCSNGLMVLSLASVISFISLYYYQLPTHHCPFCLLQKEYHYVGYPLYISLFIAGISGAGVGVIHRFRSAASLREVVPRLQKRLSLVSVAAYGVFAAIASYPMLFTSFVLE